MARTARTKKTEVMPETVEEQVVVEDKAVAEVPVEEPAVEKKPRAKKATEPKAEDAKDKEIDSLKAELEQLRELVKAQSNQPQTVYVQSDSAERVWFLWIADVANDNQLLIGEHGQYGRIVGKTGNFYVPKNDLSRILDSAIRYYIENRWLIVVSGLDEDEREALGVNYRKGELLDEKMFRRLMTVSREEMLEVFPALCEQHKEMVASTYHAEYERGTPIDRELVVKLNKIYPSEAFKDIIEKMNAKDLD